MGEVLVMLCIVLKPIVTCRPGITFILSGKPGS